MYRRQINIENLPAAPQLHDREVGSNKILKNNKNRYNFWLYNVEL